LNASYSGSNPHTQRVIDINNDDDMVQVRCVARNIARDLGFSLVDQTKLVTAASELARNVAVHGGGGAVAIDVLQTAGRTGIKLVFKDRGPGIEDIELALKDGYTTGKGLGIGLGGAKRLVHEFEIDSRPGEGTQVMIIRWK